MKNLSLLISIFLPVFFYSCNCNKEKKIEKILHSDNGQLWGVYDTCFKTTEKSYFFQPNGICHHLVEMKGFGLEFKAGDADMFFDSTWNVIVQNENVYLRLIFDSYKVVDYNNDYFKLMNKQGEFFYLNKSSCKTNRNCYIQKEVEPAPW